MISPLHSSLCLVSSQPTVVAPPPPSRASTRTWLYRELRGGGWDRQKIQGNIEMPSNTLNEVPLVTIHRSVQVGEPELQVSTRAPRRKKILPLLVTLSGHR